MPKAKFAQCDKCPLKDSPFVSSEGLNLETSDFIFIGEAPGKEEVIAERPFVGQSGQLLNHVLSWLKIDRQKCLITNSCLCRPELNRTPTFEEIQCCRERLIYEITQKQPKVLITMGAIANKSIFNNETIGITEFRKTPGIWSDDFKCWIVPTFHPAALLYTPSKFIEYRGDLKKITFLKDKEKGYYSIKTKRYILDTFDKFFRACEIIESKKLVVIDVETTGLDWKIDKILEIGITYKEDTALIVPREMLEYNFVRSRLQEIFKNNNIIFIYQNGQFDTKFLITQYGFDVRINEDTMLLHYCIDERRGIHSLTNLSMEYLGAEDYEAEFKKTIPRFVGKGKDKRPGNYGDAPKDELYKYLSHDTDYTFKLLKIFKDILSKNNYDKIRERIYNRILIPGVNVLKDVEIRGFKVDLEYLKNLDKKYTEILKKLREDIYHIVEIDYKFLPEQYVKDIGTKAKPKRFNLDSPKQLAYVLYDLIGFSVKKRSTDKQALETLFYDVLKLACPESEPGRLEFVHLGHRGDEKIYIKKEKLEISKNRLVNNIILYRRYNTIYTKFIVAMIEHAKYDERVHGSFFISGTETGRLSSNDPNLQNIPREPEIKGIFVARKGYKLLEADYSQVELRVLAFLSQDKLLLKIYKEGRDLHSEVAKELFGENFTKEQRVMTKFINFGIPYGRQSYSISRQLQIPEEEARKMLHEWNRKYIGASNWIAEQKQKLKEGKIPETIFGRKRRFGLITDDNRKSIEKKAVNFQMQSTASDLLLLSAIELSNELKNNDAFLVNLVHDSIIFEIKEDKILEIATKIKTTMERIPEEELNPGIPFIANISVGDRWGSCKNINFKEVI